MANIQAPRLGDAQRTRTGSARDRHTCPPRLRCKRPSRFTYDLVREFHACIADVDTRPGDELADLVLGLPRYPSNSRPSFATLTVMAWTYRLSAWRRVANLLVRTLLRTGVGPPRTYLLTVRGRTSGRAYSTPVTLVEENGLWWLVAPYGEVAWVRNARAAGEAILSRGRRVAMVALFESPPEEAAPVLKRYISDVPITRPYFDVTPASDLTAFAAEASRHPVFRIVPTTEGSL